METRKSIIVYQRHTHHWNGTPLLLSPLVRDSSRGIPQLPIAPESEMSFHTTHAHLNGIYRIVSRKNHGVQRTEAHLAPPVDGVAHLEAAPVHNGAVQVEEVQRVSVENRVGELPRVDRPSKPRLHTISDQRCRTDRENL